MISRNNQNKLHITTLVFSFLPILIAICLQYLTVIVDIIVLFFKNLFSDDKTISTRTMGTILTQDFNQPMNQAYMLITRYLLFIIVFGIWYYKAFVKDDRFSFFSCLKSSLKTNLRPLASLCLIIMGIAAQLFVDGILVLARPYFTNAFSKYDSMVQNVTGAGSSWAMTLAVMLIAPIGEEFLFRGLIFRYAQSCLAVFPAILLQAVIFGVYHGNIIQGLYAFFLGILLGAVCFKAKSVIPCIILHMSINISLFFIPSALFKTTSLTLITCIAGGMVLILCIVLILKNQKKPSSPAI